MDPALTAAEQAGFPLLSAIVFAPLLAGLAALVAPSEAAARRVGLAGAALTLGLSLWALALFRPELAGMQLVERALWIPSLNVRYLLGVDGLSILLLPATAVLGLGVLVGTWTSVNVQPRVWVALVLALEGLVLGVYTALDLVLFFAFWELTLLPLYFLVGLWGVGPERRFAALKYTLFMLAGGLPLLFGVILLGLNHQEARGVLAFDLPSLLSLEVPPDRARIVFLLLLVGFGVKVPFAPLHTWLPTVAMEGRPGGTALIVGLKLGIYGLLRFAFPLVPGAARELSWVVAGLGAFGALYGAVVALNQANLRRLLAWASMSHASLLVAGLAAMNVQGVQGVAFELAGLALVSGGLFLLVGYLFHRRGTSDLGSLGGLMRSAPRLSALFLLFSLASVGLPGTTGFVGELLAIRGVAKVYLPLAVVLLLAAVLTAAALWSGWRRAFLGPPRVEIADLRPRELALAVGLAALVVLGGLAPGPLLDLSAAAARGWVERVGGR